MIEDSLGSGGINYQPTASLGRGIEDQKFMSERTQGIINAASKFFNERLLELGEDERRDVRGKEREKELKVMNGEKDRRKRQSEKH